ncbi:hypothetical protein ASPZODRAFT_147055 [Penicilliopsis zonata CBS 506.65]|uniref:Protein kinase domain-containing protein n=1 Tax=Penicilliopsis zonata CBS 506.65 TaxID=1073090 RepID=A0A1L9S696_9EURO|nr:hypothetical protein ASPZODRAFT_147055 [Penicilliopsis zonata CBS 506.65]OJJ42643.1 hypothetical protein ASPZODRAFT_147055 [Penicilliopsis zonata CBS 506.65]
MVEFEKRFPPCSYFPNGTLFKRREGQAVQIQAYTVHLTTVLKEYCSEATDNYNVVFEGCITAGPDRTGQAVIVKFSYELIHQRWTSVGQEWLRSNAKERFRNECQAMIQCADSGTLPRYIAHEEQIQGGPQDLNPGASVFIILRLKMQGEQLLPEYRRFKPLKLSRKEMQSIRKQVLEAHESWRQLGWYGCPDISDIFYHQESGKVFFLGLSSMSWDQRIIDKPPIDSDSYELTLSNLPEEWDENEWDEEEDEEVTNQRERNAQMAVDMDRSQVAGEK